MRRGSTSEPAQSTTAPSPSRNSRLLDLRTAADYIGCSYWTLRDLVLNGHVPAVRIPCPRAKDGRALRRILIDVRDIDRLIESWKEVNHADITPRPVTVRYVPRVRGPASARGETQSAEGGEGTVSASEAPRTERRNPQWE